MNQWAITDTDGVILQVVDAAEAPDEPGQTATLLDEWHGWPPEPWPGAQLRLIDGVPQYVDDRPLAAVKAAKIAAIDEARLAANQDTFQIGALAFRVDPLSRSDIDGVSDYVALFDELPPNWPGAWRAADGSMYPITTVAEWRTFVEAMVVQGVQHFLHAEALKAAVLAAESNSAVEAVPSW
jgi:hypothetical protein